MVLDFSSLIGLAGPSEWPERVVQEGGAGAGAQGAGGWCGRCDRDIQDALDVSSGACAGKGPGESDAG